jgi:hypothetical protein
MSTSLLGACRAGAACVRVRRALRMCAHVCAAKRTARPLLPLTSGCTPLYSDSYRRSDLRDLKEPCLKTILALSNC